MWTDEVLSTEGELAEIRLFQKRAKERHWCDGVKSHGPKLKEIVPLRKRPRENGKTLHLLRKSLRLDIVARRDPAFEESFRRLSAPFLCSPYMYPPESWVLNVPDRRQKNSTCFLRESRRAATHGTARSTGTSRVQYGHLRLACSKGAEGLFYCVDRSRPPTRRLDYQHPCKLTSSQE